MMKFFYLITYFLLLLSPLNAQFIDPQAGQYSGNSGIKDFKPSEASLDEIRQFYLASVSRPNEFINGREYLVYYYRSKTSPLLFKGAQFHTTLNMNGRTYENINLQYDTYLDELMFADTLRVTQSELPRVALNKNLVEGFSFIYNGEPYRFRNMRFANEQGVSDGFYEIAYDGPTMFIIKHRSTVYERDAIVEYKYSSLKYVFTGGRFNKVTKLKDFLLMFGDKSQQIKEFIQEKGIRFKKADKNRISSILQYYDSLTNQVKE